MKIFGYEITRERVATVDKPVAPAAEKTTVSSLKGRQRRSLQAAATGRLEEGWQTWPVQPAAVIQEKWMTLVARSRHAGENQDHAKKFLLLMQDNIVGPNGFQLHAQIKSDNDKPDKPANDAIETAYYEQSKIGNFTTDGALSRHACERLWAATMAETGEAIAIIHYGTDAGPTGFSIELVDPVFLNPAHTQETTRGTVIMHGIEFDKNTMRPIAYHFQNFKETQTGQINYYGASAGGTRIVAADQVIHSFIMERPGQRRGLPWMRTGLWRLRMLSAFEDAATVNARVTASKSVYYRNDDGEEVSQDDLSETLEPGTAQHIGSNHIEQFNPQFPDATLKPFRDGILQSIAGGWGVSSLSLSGDFSQANFTSGRLGELPARDFFMSLQNFMKETFVEKVYRAWLAYNLLRGTLKVGKGALRIDRAAKYENVSFHGRRWAHIQPAEESTANANAIANKIKSRTEIVRDLGRDYPEVLDEIEREEQEMKARGIDPTPDVPGSTKKPAGDAPAKKPPAAE